MYAEKPWLAHYPPEVPPTLEYPEVTLDYFLEEAARQHGEVTATIFYGGRQTYRQVYDQARRLAGALRRLGVAEGDRVAILLPNCPQVVIAYYAVLMAGGVVVMVNPLYTPRELKHQLVDSGARVLVALDLVWGRVAEVWPDTQVEHIIVTGLGEYMGLPLRWLYPLKARRQRPRIPYGPRVHRFQALLREPPLAERHHRRPDDLALLQYTGGTTGLAKGCMLTHRNLVANCWQIRAWLYKFRGRRAVTIGALPLFHVYGMTAVMNFSVASASTVVLVPRFDPGEVLKLIQKYRPALFPGAPTMYIALLNHPRLREYDLSGIEACISGAAPLPLEVQEKFEAVTGGRLVEGYGLSETSPVTHANPIWGRRKPGSIGLPWPDTEARVVTPDGWDDVPVGEAGELVIRGPQVMKGYWNRPEETAQVLSPDGWLRTGDIARMDEEGYFYIVDRKKDVIIAGGFNIYPREVEEVLYAHPAIQEAAVVGVPDPYRGETVKAFVVLKPGATLTQEELEAYCRQHLAPYKVPRLVEFRESLPKSLVGKVLRRVLREEEGERQAREVVAASRMAAEGGALGGEGSAPGGAGA
ncbi:MAG: long-chain fatty acid--CoA ligase [Firmicutes bacterium]|nr:long-chain fatty acid--CoA ligase [Bacillota bacterium]